jgi:hypothetical protein
MSSTLRRAVLVSTMLVLVGATSSGGASASPLVRPPAGSPDPKAMVLAKSDFRAAKVTKQGYYKDRDFPSVISYAREFSDARVGSAQLLDVKSDAEIGTSAQSTTSFLQTIKRLFASKQGRALLKAAILSDAPKYLAPRVQIGRPRALGVGVGSFTMLITVHVVGLAFEARVSYFRVERVLGDVLALGDPLAGGGVPLSVVRSLAGTMAGRMETELAPKNTVAPTVTGMPQVGQTLTASAGTWSGSPASFAYQWQRCDSSGANCSNISAATGQTYLLANPDAGSRIRVAVTATSTTGSATVFSDATAPIAALGAPTNTSPPVVSGTAQVGQTLSASTGSWTGSPTTFSFQWQRCDATGTSCADITGATSGTYVVTTSDRGSTLRVAVMAQNAVGPATAFSATTAVVS